MDTRPNPSLAPHDHRYEILRNTALFDALSDRELGLLAARLTEIQVPTDQVLLTQGEPANQVFWLMTGSVQVVVQGEIVAQVQTVQCFGEMSCLVPDSDCSATIVTREPCTILSIEREPFIEVLSSVPKLWQTLFIQTTQRLSTSNKRLSEVLAHVPQGFMKLDQFACVTQEYSEKCTRYFGENNLAGRRFLDLLKLTDPQESESWLEIYAMLFSDSLVPFDDLTALLTKEHRIEANGEARDLLLSYHPSLNVEGGIEAIDVGIEDVTALRKLELSNAALHYEQSVLGRIYSDPESFLSMLDLMAVAIAECQELCRFNTSADSSFVASQLEGTLRSVHSLKGLAGVFGLEPVARCCDEMAIPIRELGQQLALHVLSHHQTVFRGFKEEFVAGIARLEFEARQAQTLQKKIGETLLKRLKGVVLSQEEFAKLKEYLKFAQLAPALAIIEAAQARDSLQLFNNWHVKVDLLARTLAKNVRFELTGAGGSINKDLFSELASVLVHVMNNAVDHGIEKPEVREDHGKSRQGVIRASVAVVREALELSIFDDGKGIDMSALPDLAKAQLNVDQQAVLTYVAAGELWRILLLPGFTTSTVVTRFSGYGVGLDSLNRLVLERAGDLSVASTPGEGTTVSIRLPLVNAREQPYVS